MSFLKKINLFLKEFLFPKFCLGCGRVGLYICDQCQKEIKKFENTKCFYCNKKTLFGLTHSKCFKKYRFNGFLSLYQYNWLLKKIIKNFKYRLALEIWEDFKKNINPQELNIIKHWGRIDFLQPIPIEKIKLNSRGFNQSFIISRYFNSFLNLNFGDFLIKKSFFNKPQAMISSPKERKKNIKNSFLVINKEKLLNKNLLLVDDVITTGSTLEEAIKNLRKFGAKNIFVLTLAKG